MPEKTAVKPELPEDYELLIDLEKRANALGAQSVEAIGIGWEDDTKRCYVARATVVTAEGVTRRMDGFATPGDCPDGDGDMNADRWVRERARARALRSAIRAAYGDDADRTQPAHIREAQALIRECADHVGQPRDKIAAEVHTLCGVRSINDLTERQVVDLRLWIRGRKATKGA
jgi:hypothetical protein